MLICSVSLHPPRVIANAVAEIAHAVDTVGTENVVLTALVDDPASADDIFVVTIGDVIEEAASAADDVRVPSIYDVATTESATASSAEDATVVSGVTWNPADKGVAVSLSNGNLSAQGTSASGTIAVRATSSRSSGKYYFEVTITGTVQNAGPGIALATANVINSAGFVGEGLAALSTGNVFINSGTLQGTVGTYAVNDVCCVAVDLTNQKIHFRKNGGNWNNNAAHDPATNTGGFSISFISSNPVYPLALFAATTLSILTANFGATAFAQTPPSGFSAWQ